MALPNLLKRRAPDIADTRPAELSDPQSRTRARRRLIGAAVLLVAGIIAFPLLFETQPRPISVDIPLVIPSRDGATPLALPPRSGRVASGAIATDAPPAAALQPEAPAPAGAASAARAVVPPAPAVAPGAAVVEVKPAAAPQTAPAVQPALKTAEKAPEKASQKATEKATEKASEKAQPKVPEKAVEKASEKAAEKAATKPTAPAAATKAASFVVQVGAYADEAAAKEAKAKVERLGLKAFTQDVEVQGARRIRVRVGPFASQEDAAKAVATLKAGKLPGVVLTL